MKIRFYLTALLALILVSSFAQAQGKKYKAVVSFHSECCGVPDDQPLIDFISSFKKTHKIKKINYDHIGPLGKEGEYDMAFTLKELCKKDQSAFVAGLKKIIPQLKSKGSASLAENETVDASQMGRATLTNKQL